MKRDYTELPTPNFLSRETFQLKKISDAGERTIKHGEEDGGKHEVDESHRCWSRKIS